VVILFLLKIQVMEYGEYKFEEIETSEKDFLLKLGREYSIYLEKVVHKTDEVLFELSREYGDYLKQIMPVKYNHVKYQLINMFHTSHCMKCGLCGNCPISDVFIIESAYGKKIKLGNNCVNSLFNLEISKWFKSYRQKRENIIKNIKKIEGLSALISECKNCKLSCNIPFGEVEKLKELLELMCKGLNLSWQQESLAENYLDGKKRLCA